MPEKTFADRLKEAMARQGKKQVDLIGQLRTRASSWERAI